MTITAELSTAAQRGLLAFGENGQARRSNNTDRERHRVYWQTITTLERAGLCQHSAGFDSFELTALGRTALAELNAREVTA